MASEETVLTLKRGSRVIEIDDLSICVPEQKGIYAIYENGVQMADFMTSTPFGPIGRPLAELAWEALDETEAEDE
jgi:hypothetical protein